MEESGLDGIRDHPVGAHTEGQLPRTRGGADEGAVGGEAQSLHFGI